MCEGSHMREEIEKTSKNGRAEERTQRVNACDSECVSGEQSEEECEEGENEAVLLASITAMVSQETRKNNSAVC